MTRINAAIQPARLKDKHLLAEHREIKRIPNQISKGRYNLDGIPNEFCLGTGHVKFFYNKLLYLLNRYHQIHRECKRRGFNVQNWSAAWDEVPPALMNNWEPDDRVKELLETRIRDRGGFLNE